MNHVIPLRPFKTVLDNVLLEYGGLPHVLPLAVHLISLPEHKILVSAPVPLELILTGFDRVGAGPLGRGLTIEAALSDVSKYTH